MSFFPEVRHGAGVEKDSQSAGELQRRKASRAQTWAITSVRTEDHGKLRKKKNVKKGIGMRTWPGNIDLPICVILIQTPLDALLKHDC